MQRGDGPSSPSYIIKESPLAAEMARSTVTLLGQERVHSLPVSIVNIHPIFIAGFAELTDKHIISSRRGREGAGALPIITNNGTTNGIDLNAANSVNRDRTSRDSHTEAGESGIPRGPGNSERTGRDEPDDPLSILLETFFLDKTPYPSRPAIRRAAERQARPYMHPESAFAGRDEVTGYAIDPANRPDHDDAIYAERTPRGWNVRISVPDVSFITEFATVVRAAITTGYSKFVEDKTVLYMLPRIFSDNLFSLSGKTPSFSMDIRFDSKGRRVRFKPSLTLIDPINLSYSTANRHLRDHETSKHGRTLLEYDKLAEVLAHAQEERTDYPASQGKTRADFIVQQFMHEFNGALGQFMEEHNIPGIFRNHMFPSGPVPEDIIPRLLAADPDMRLAEAYEHQQLAMGRSVLSTTPYMHEGLGFDALAPGTSPLRKAEDFINICNTIAFMTKKPYPFPAEILPLIVEHLNRVREAERGDTRQARRRRSAKQIQARLIEDFTAGIMTTAGLDEFLDGPANVSVYNKLTQDNFSAITTHAALRDILPGPFVDDYVRRAKTKSLGLIDVGEILLSDAGRATTEEFEPEASLPESGWNEVTEASIHFLYREPTQAVDILNAASVRGIVENVIVTQTQSEIGFSSMVSFTDTRTGRPIQATVVNAPSYESAQFFAIINALQARVGRLEAVNTEPYAATPQELSKSRGRQRMEFNQVARRLGVFLHQHTFAQASFIDRRVDTHTYHTEAQVQIGERVIQSSGIGSSEEEARDEAAMSIMHQLDILTVSGDPNFKPYSTQTAISTLMERQQRWHMPDPEYEFHTHENRDNRTCTLTVIGTDGRPVTFETSEPIESRTSGSPMRSEVHKAGKRAKTRVAKLAVATILSTEPPAEPTS